MRLITAAGRLALHSGLSSVKISAACLVGREDSLKLRGWLLLLLFAHVMLHPWVHAMGNAATVSAASLSDASTASRHAQVAGDQCELCRVGHNATAAAPLPTTELLNPRWIHTALQAANYASLQADHRVPSRAPPIS